MSVTKKSHYVWQYYLKSWATKDSIYCSIDGRTPFLTSLDNVANKRYFYKLKKFNEDEKEFLINLINKNLPSFVVDSLKEYINNIEKYFQWQDTHNASTTNEVNNIQIGEDEMSSIETGCLKLINNLKSGNIQYCISEENRITLYIFVAMQYLRTKRIYDDLVQGNLQEINTENIIAPFRKIMSFNIAYYFYALDYKILLLRNRTNQEFITSDQPVINTLVDYSKLNRHTDDMKLYYPISPSIAILITRDEQIDGEVKYLDLNSVEKYNMQMVMASQHQVYCSSSRSLAKYI